MPTYKVNFGGIEYDFSDYEWENDDEIDRVNETLPEEYECTVVAENREEAIHAATNILTDVTGWCIQNVIEIDVREISTKPHHSTP